MPDQDLTGFSRLCPSCGRRVPRSVATCRCGAELPPDTQAPIEAAAEESSSGGAPKAIIAAVALIAAAGAGYWVAARPAPATSVVSAPAEEDQAAEPIPAAPAANPSPEQRAWDASASAKDPLPAPPPIDPAPTPLTPAPSALSNSIEDMVDRVMPAVVLIETTKGRGSGFFVRYDTLITNVHVVQQDGYVTLRRMDGSSMSARVETRAPAFDIAVLKVTTPSSSQAIIPMGSAKSLKPGQEIIVIGSALGTLQNTVSRGIVSGLRHSGGATLVQTDAATNPGNSGGPMLDRNGSVIGITTMGYRGAEGLNFAVAIDHARDVLEGRQANLGTQTGLTDIQSRPRGDTSESDRRQEQGDEQFRGRIDQLADAAGSLDGAWQRFRDQCFKSAIPGYYSREWFVVLTPRGLPGGAPAGCLAYYNQMAGEMNKFRDLMRQSLDDARRANVLPGTIRDVLRSKRLEFDGW